MPGGRPSSYRAEYVEQVYKLALLGANDDEIASIFSVTAQTLYNWDKLHPEFLASRARGKDLADANVAERLYKRALGYEHDAVKIMQYEGEPVIVPYTEHYPPDTQAASWWLKNRQSAKWKDRHEVTGADGGPIEFAAVLMAARERRIAGPLIEADTTTLNTLNVAVEPEKVAAKPSDPTDNG